jgi:hypothetical protein
MLAVLLASDDPRTSWFFQTSNGGSRKTGRATSVSKSATAEKLTPKTWTSAETLEHWLSGRNRLGILVDKDDLINYQLLII